MFPSTKIILITATLGLFLVFAGTANAGVIRKPPINLGLVGYWSFDVGKGGLTAVDQSGNGNTGTLTNMDASSDWVDGKLGQALDFDGSNDYVELGTSAANLAGAGGLSISAWVNTLEDYSVQGSILTRANSSVKQYALFISPNSNFSGWIFSGTSGVANAVSATTVNIDQWYHVVYTYDGDYGRIYVNGILDGTSSNFTGGIQAAIINLRIGARLIPEDAFGHVFNGKIDEVRIYNRALSANEVARLYRLQKPKILAPNNNGLVGYWSFNEGSGGYAGDMSGNNNTGTLTNMDASSDWVDGKLGQALDFDGSNDYVDGGNTASLQLTTGTVSAWIKTSNAGTNYRGIVAKQNAYGMFLFSNVFVVYDWGTSKQRSTGVNLADSTWHFVAFSFQSGVSGGSTLYIDGVNRVATTTTILNQNVNFQIGWANAASQQFSGLIDEVRIYNRALSAAEVAGLYNTGLAKINSSTKGQLTDGLVGHWTFDGPDIDFTTNLATDISGNGNNGRLTNMSTSTAPTIGRLGQALDFDGSNDYVNIGDKNIYDFGSNKNFSVSFWFQTSDDATGQSWPGFLSKEISQVSPRQGWNIALSSTAGELNTVFIETLSSGTQDVAVSTKAVNDGIWHHVVGIRDTVTSQISLFLDGQLQESNPLNSTGDLSNAVALNFGVRNQNSPGAGHYLRAGIDEVRIYNRALSASEVKRLYNMGR